MFQWVLHIDPTAKFCMLQKLTKRDFVGPFDAVVTFHGKSHPLGLRVFSAKVCELFMRHRRTGVPCLQIAMKSVPAIEWDQDFIEANVDFVGSLTLKGTKITVGERFKDARTTLRSVRKSILNKRAMPTIKDGDAFLEFVVAALQGACDPDWTIGYKENSGKDDKNTLQLCERWLSLTGTGPSRMWLMEPPVWLSIRIELGKLFSKGEDEPFAFADGMGEDEQPVDTYKSLSLDARPVGFSAPENIHVLTVQSMSLEETLKDKLAKVSDLMVEVGCLPDAADGDAPTMPEPVLKAVTEAMRVSPLLSSLVRKR